MRSISPMTASIGRLRASVNGRAGQVARIPDSSLITRGAGWEGAAGRQAGAAERAEAHRPVAQFGRAGTNRLEIGTVGEPLGLAGHRVQEGDVVGGAELIA